MSSDSAGFDRNTVVWKKSKRSGGSGGNCVEVARLINGGRAVRDSKNPEGSVFLFTSSEWSAFIDGVKSGKFGSRSA